MKVLQIIGCTVILSMSSVASAQLIDLKKLRSKETQAEIKRKTEAQSVGSRTDKEPSAKIGNAGGVDFTSDFARAHEKLKPNEAPVSSRFSDEPARRSADRFFGSSGSTTNSSPPPALDGKMRHLPTS